LNPLRAFLLWCSTNPVLAQHLPRLPFVRRAVRRFLPGETLEDGLGAARRLEAGGLLSVLTLLGENVTTREDASAVADHYVEALGEIHRRGLAAEISVKPTHLGLDGGLTLARPNLARILARAEETSSFVWIDMEGSAYVEATLELFRELASRHRRVGLCVQAYLRRTEADVHSLLDVAPGLRLVKGAYAEPASLAYRSRRDVDDAYLRLALRLLERAAGGGFRPGIATHDRRLLEHVFAEAERLSLPRAAYEVQMLYGIGAETQERLARRGHRVRVLVSYGPAWFAWYARRLAERPANLGFLLRSLFAR
jgi:proline dehydrogenase